MIDFRERSRWRRFFYSKPLFAAVLIFAAAITQGAWSMHGKSIEASEKRDLALEKLEKLEKRKGELEEDIARLSTPRGVEEEIRERYMVAKEGESVIIVSEPEEATAHSVMVPDESPPVSFWGKLLGAVGVVE